MIEFIKHWDWVILGFGFFHAILFLQSGLDKVFNYKDNASWLNGHFANSIFKNMVPMLLILLTILELGAGALSVGAVVSEMIGCESHDLVWLSVIASIKAYLALFLGQRLAKDYEGAASIAPYFMIALAAAIYLQFAL